MMLPFRMIVEVVYGSQNRQNRWIPVFMPFSSSVSLVRLTESQSHHTEQNEGLHQRINELKSSLGSTQQEASQWMARYDSLMEQHQGLDLTMTKLDNHCEVKWTSEFPSRE